MSPEQEIAALREELALERAKVRELATALAIAAQKNAEAEASRADAEATLARAKALRSERNRRYRDAKKTSLRREEDVSETSQPFPLLDGSPSLSAPISPPPLSSPNPSFLAASQSETATQPLLVVVQPTSEDSKPKKAVGRSNALGDFIDWAKAETRKHLAPDAPDNCRLEKHQAARLGEAVRDHGLEAVKAAFRLWMGWAVAQEKGYPLGLFAAKWEGWVGQVKAPKPAAAQAQDARTEAHREAYAKYLASKAAGGES